MSQQQLKTYIHRTTRQVVTVKQGTPQWEGLKDSPSWIPTYEEDTKDGLLSELSKDKLIQLAQGKGATAHHTKDEIVEMLEIKSTKLVPYFDDNLVG
jgi:hypothetical protein